MKYKVAVTVAFFFIYKIFLMIWGIEEAIILGLAMITCFLAEIEYNSRNKNSIEKPNDTKHDYLTKI